MSETELIVRYAETDQMQVVHHSVYPVWFEAARTDLMEKAGYPYHRIEKEGIMLPLSRLDCRYIAGARYGDRVIIKCRVSKLTVVRLELYYEVYRKEGGELLATGITEHGWTDTSLKVVNLKKKAPDLFSLLEAIRDENPA